MYLRKINCIATYLINIRFHREVLLFYNSCFLLEGNKSNILYFHTALFLFGEINVLYLLWSKFFFKFYKNFSEIFWNAKICCEKLFPGSEICKFWKVKKSRDYAYCSLWSSSSKMWSHWNQGVCETWKPSSAKVILLFLLFFWADWDKSELTYKVFKFYLSFYTYLH